MGASLLHTGDIAAGRKHFDHAIALYDPAVHQPLAARFGQDLGVSLLSYRSWTLWLLGYPMAALSDADEALKNAREIGQAATLLYALTNAAITYTFCGNYGAAAAQAREHVALAGQKGAFWKSYGMMNLGRILALTGKASDATRMLMSGIAAYRTTGATLWNRSIWRIWLALMQSLANSRRRGDVSAKH